MKNHQNKMLSRKINSIIGLIKTKYIYRKNITLRGKVRITGNPIFVFHLNARLILGDNVSLKSNKSSYHLNMHSPVKIMGDRKESKIEIGDNTRINGSCIHSYESIKIGKNCLIAANCQIIDGNGHDLSFENVENRIRTKGKTKPIVIEDNVWIGANSIILPGTRIGYGSVIRAGSVVCNDIPKMCLAGGNPAQVIKKYAE